MTHEPIRVIHFSPHITWQGTQAELDAMLADGWPDGTASEVIAACKRDAAEAMAYAAELDAKLALAAEAIDGLLAILPDDEGPEIDFARTTIPEVRRYKP